MTIDDVMSLVMTRGHASRMEWATEDEIRAAILALLDAEAEVCVGIVAPEQIPFSDTEWTVRCEIAESIRARIAARKGGNDD